MTIEETIKLCEYLNQSNDEYELDEELNQIKERLTDIDYKLQILIEHFQLENKIDF